MQHFSKGILLLILLVCANNASAQDQQRNGLQLYQQAVRELNERAYQGYQQIHQNKLYKEAQQEILAMLVEKAPLNFSKAVFLHENAYKGGLLSYEQFLAKIKAELARRLANNKPTTGYRKADSLQVQLQAALFKLFTDTTWARLGNPEIDPPTNQTTPLAPPRYAWENFDGRRDWEVMLVSYLLEKNEGNCHSLPYLYKMVADELQIPAWLSCAPHHFYIQSYSQQTGMFNTELSSATFPKDSWLMASGYVGKDAIKSRTYMDTLTQQESIALCLVDLAQSHQKLYPQETEFSLECLQKARQYYPHSMVACLTEIQIRSTQQKHKPTPKNAQELERLAKKVCDLGYREIPKAEYVRWLANPYKMLNKIGGEQATEGKFEDEPLPTFKLNTLSKGKYEEQSDLVKPRKIGAILFDPKTGKMIGFAPADTSVVAVEVNARFLSVDPLTKSYPELTPYQFASNTPIMAIDLDGEEAKIVVNRITRTTTIVLNLSYHSKNGVKGTTAQEKRRYKNGLSPREVRDFGRDLQSEFAKAGRQVDSQTGYEIRLQASFEELPLNVTVPRRDFSTNNNSVLIDYSLSSSGSTAGSTVWRNSSFQRGANAHTKMHEISHLIIHNARYANDPAGNWARFIRQYHPLCIEITEGAPNVMAHRESDGVSKGIFTYGHDENGKAVGTGDLNSQNVHDMVGVVRAISNNVEEIPLPAIGMPPRPTLPNNFLLTPIQTIPRAPTNRSNNAGERDTGAGGKDDKP